VAELLSDFRTLQYYIAAAPCNPTDMDDYYTEGWAALRQCALDGQHILNCAADVTVPRATGGPDEQVKAELKQCVVLFSIPPPSFSASPPLPAHLTPSRVLLDAYARRHEGQKIYLRQAAAQRWIEWRDQILMGGRPHQGNQAQLLAVDDHLRVVSSALFVTLEWHPHSLPVLPLSQPLPGHPLPPCLSHHW
jgi:hypothetical protein